MCRCRSTIPYHSYTMYTYSLWDMWKTLSIQTVQLVLMLSCGFSSVLSQKLVTPTATAIATTMSHYQNLRFPQQRSFFFLNR